jgi:hypothetical protein
MTIMMANNAARTPRNRLVRSRSRARAAVDWARPAGSRPVRVAPYGARPAVGVSGAAHPVSGPVADRLSTPQLLAAGVLSAAVVAGLIGIAHWRAGGSDPAPAEVPARAPVSVSAPGSGPVLAPRPDGGFAGGGR